MNKPRARADGLPYRVYGRRGIRGYSIGYKLPGGVWAFRLSCPITDWAKIVELRSDAIQRASQIGLGRPSTDGVDALITAWFAWQDAKPEASEEKRAASTMAENKREASNLRKAFGHMSVATVIKSDAHNYLDACVRAKRPEKGNKEIALMRLILEYGVRTGMIVTSPFDGVTKLRTVKTQRLVSDAELDLAVRVGRRLGSSRLIVALALKTAWLCLRRSVEVRVFTRDQIKTDGIEWEAAKRQGGQAVRRGLIEWSPELRKTINEALAIPRNKLAGSWFVFGNLRGQKYTKGGWKKTLSTLMVECVEQAKTEKIAFLPFSLQDCRPKGVTDKLANKDLDVMDATMHTSEKMITAIYDRRRVRVAKPAA